MLNKVLITGRLTSDIQLKFTQNGAAYTNFCVAVERSYKEVSGERKVDFIYATAWKATAEFLQKYFAKGSPLTLEGRLQTRVWTDTSGNTKSALELIATEVGFVPSLPAPPKAEDTGAVSNDTANQINQLN